MLVVKQSLLGSINKESLQGIKTALVNARVRLLSSINKESLQGIKTIP